MVLPGYEKWVESPYRGGIRAKGKGWIQYDFIYEGVRYRPTVDRVPREANQRRARVHLLEIKARIKNWAAPGFIDTSFGVMDFPRSGGHLRAMI
jgi:hypothetical protein